jgi:hypothetical protein
LFDVSALQQSLLVVLAHLTHVSSQFVSVAQHVAEVNTGTLARFCITKYHLHARMSAFFTQMDRWLRKRVCQDSDTDAEDPAGLSSIRAVLSLHTSSTASEQPVSVQLKLVSNTGTQVCDRSKPHLVLTLQHEDEQEAAMAVLASMYKVKPLPELLSELTQVQQLQAAVLADVWGLPEVSTEAVRLLLAAADKGAGLSYELVMHYAQMQAVPSCLVRLPPKIVAVCLDSSTEHTLSNFRSAAQQAVLTFLGDLNAVSADAALLQQLLVLPHRECHSLMVGAPACVGWQSRIYT